MAYLRKLVCMFILASVATMASANYTYSWYLMASTTLNEAYVSLNQDGSCGTFLAYTPKVGYVYAFRPNYNSGNPVLISGNLRGCSASRISADGNCVVFWSLNPANQYVPTLVTWNSLTNSWNSPQFAPVTSTTLPAPPANSGPCSIGVSDILPTGRVVLVFRDPAILPAPPPPGRLMKWDTVSGVTIIPTTYVGHHPWLDPTGTIMTYVGEGPTTHLIYRYNFATGIDTCISVDALGNYANSACGYPQCSGDSRYVVYQSKASNLDGANPQGYFNVFICDTQTGLFGTTTRAYDYANQDTGQTGADVVFPSISYDGNWVAYQSEAQGLLPGYPPFGGPSVLLIPRANRSLIEMASLTMLGAVAIGHKPSVANDAVIGFHSPSTGIAAGDTTTPLHGYKLWGHY